MAIHPHTSDITEMMMKKSAQATNARRSREKKERGTNILTD